MLSYILYSVNIEVHVTVMYYVYISPSSSLALLGVCLDAQGKFLTMAGRPKEAINTYTEAKKIAVELFTENSLQVYLLV